MASRLPGFDRLPAPTVLLLHELPDGSSHIDWMIAHEPEGCEPLTTFRLAQRVDRMTPGAEIIAHRIADHRAAYLDYEGPISNDRGRVSRLRRGEVITACAVPHFTDINRIAIAWSINETGCFTQHLQLEPLGSEEVRVRCLAVESATNAPLVAAGPRIKEET